MAQSGYTPILIYASGSTGNTPSAANLTSSASGAELALNYFDGKLFYKDASGNVQVLASKAAASTTISFGTTGLTPSTASTGAITVAGTLITSNGGTGLSSYTAGDLPYYASGTALSKLAIGTSGYVLTSSGTAPQWTQLSTIGVTTFSAGTTGFTPSSATSGAVTLAGTLATTNGGTGLTSFTANGVVYASSTSALATGSGITYNGTTFSTSNDASIHGLTVGLGGGSVSTNTAVGASALNANTSGANNTAIGYQAAYSNTSGGQITAVGYQAGYTSNSVGGTYLTAVGFKAAYTSSTTGTICAIGYNALTANTSGADNTAVGSYNALGSNTTGSYNTAVGREALNSNTTASYNTAVGYQAGYSNTAADNTFLGYKSGYLTGAGTGNVALGSGSSYPTLYNNSTGNYNTVIGFSAGWGVTGSSNTLIGQNSGSGITSGSKNTVLGSYSGNQGGLDIRTSSNNIVLSDGDGNPRFFYTSSNGFCNLSGTGTGNTGAIIFKDNTNTTYWQNQTTSGNYYLANSGFSAYVYLTQSVTSWTFASDARIKNNIVDLNYGLAEILKIKPRRYNMISDNSEQIGFIAQELKTVVPEAIVGTEIPYEENDTPSEKAAKTLGISKDFLIPVLVKAIQDLNTLVTTQATEIATLKAKVGA